MGWIDLGLDALPRLSIGDDSLSGRLMCRSFGVSLSGLALSGRAVSVGRGRVLARWRRAWVIWP